jgi:hypothetical protein
VAVGAVIGDAVAVLGVLGVGGILGQYVGSSKDRRESRASVLSALAETQSLRWMGPGSASAADFQTAMRTLQTAAFIARLPRDAVWEYAVLTQAARWLNEEEWNKTRDSETDYGIDAYLAAAVREATRTISVITWSPVLMRRWRWRSAKKRIDALLTKMQSNETKNAVKRSRDTAFL